VNAMTAWKFCLFISIGLAIYPLVGYPAIVKLISMIRRCPVRRGPHDPQVTVLVPAYNEVTGIAANLECLCAQDYPVEKLQIIVISDASDDGTDEVVRSFAERGVHLLRQPARAGKAAGLNAGIRMARGEIIVFCDANARFAADAVRRLAENFADAKVGYVTGHLTLRSSGPGTSGGSAYLTYENLLRTLETRAGSVIGVNGGVDAMRKSLYFDIPADQISDFVLPLGVIRAGYRVVYDARARSEEDANEDSGTEFRMRVRVALRALRGLAYMRGAMNPLRVPLSAFFILSHKILRYLTFLFLAAALIANIVLAMHSIFYATLLGLQLACYALALLGLCRGLPIARSRLAVLPGYFLASNAAFAVAAIRFLRGDVVATWKPRSG